MAKQNRNKSNVESPKVDAPVVEAKIEPTNETDAQPAVETPKAEVPVAETTAPVVEAPVVEHSTQQLGTKKPKAKGAVESLEIKEEDSISIKYVKEILGNYLEKMKPGHSHNGQDGVLLQTSLLRAMDAIMKMEGEDFKRMYNLLLSLVHAHKDDVFSERYCFRYMGELNISPVELNRFAKLLNMVLVTADPGTRVITVKQVNIPATLETFNNESITQKLVEFYKL